MAKVEVSGWMLAHSWDFLKEGEVAWRFEHIYCLTDGASVVHKFAHTFEVDVPDNVNVVAGMVANLEAAKKKALDDYNATVKEINDRLQKLLAITNEVA